MPERRLATCRGCHHPVLFVVSADGPVVCLERHESAGGPDRYAVFDDGTAYLVPARRSVLAHPVHKCAARERRAP